MGIDGTNPPLAHLASDFTNCHSVDSKFQSLGQCTLTPSSIRPTTHLSSWSIDKEGRSSDFVSPELCKLTSASIAFFQSFEAMLAQMTDRLQHGRGYVRPSQSSHCALRSPSPGPTQQYTSDNISDTHRGQPLDRWNPLFHKWKFDACQDPVQAKVLRQGDVRWHRFKHDAHNQPRVSSDRCHTYYISQLATQVPQDVFFSYVDTHRARFSMKVPVKFCKWGRENGTCIS